MEKDGHVNDRFTISYRNNYNVGNGIHLYQMIIRFTVKGLISVQN